MKHHAVQLGTTLLDECSLDVYRTWQQRRVAPAYMRGVPTWIWQAAMRSTPG